MTDRLVNEVSRLREHIRKNYPTIADFARRSRIEDNSLRSWFQSGKIGNSDQFRRMAKMGINLHWLLTGQGPSEAPRSKESTDGA